MRLSTLVLLFCCAGLFAQAQAGHRKALIIGNSAYGSSKSTRDAFPDLSSPSRDASAVYKALKSAGVEDRDIRVYYNLKHDALIKAVHEFRKQLNDDDSVLFYFSGHGFSVDGEDFLVPIGFSFDGTKAQARRDAVGLNIIVDDLSKAPSRIVILDACRTAAPVFKGSSGNLEPMVRYPSFGSVIAFSTSTGGKASEASPGGGLSFFTYYLLKSIEDRPPDLLTALNEAQSLTSKASGNLQVPAIYNEAPYGTFPRFALYPRAGNTDIATAAPAAVSYQSAPPSPGGLLICPARGSLAAGWLIEVKPLENPDASRGIRFAPLIPTQHHQSISPILMGMISPTKFLTGAESEDMHRLTEELRSRITTVPMESSEGDVATSAVINLLDRRFDRPDVLIVTYSINLPSNTRLRTDIEEFPLSSVSPVFQSKINALDLAATELTDQACADALHRLITKP